MKEIFPKINRLSEKKALKEAYRELWKDLTLKSEILSCKRTEFRGVPHSKFVRTEKHNYFPFPLLLTSTF